MASPHQNDQIQQKESQPSTSSNEGFVPLAAKDSDWVGLSFYNPNFHKSPDDEEELQVLETSENEHPPIFLLFPCLKDKNPDLIHDESTTNVTKMLLGQQADFSNMKNSKKILPLEKILQSVPEIEDRLDFGSTDMSDMSHDNSKHGLSDDDPYDIEQDEEDKKPRRKKRRKTKSDLHIPCADSSHCDINVPKRPPSKVRISRIFSKPIIHDVPSSQESFGDDEREDA